MKVGMRSIGLKEGDMEDGVETGKVSRETEAVDEVRKLGFNGEGSKTAMVELVGRPSSTDVATE